MSVKHFFPLAASQSNLRRLLAIRCIVLICQALALFYAWRFLNLSLNYSLLSICLGLLCLMNVGVFFRISKNAPISDPEFLMHLLVDVIGLSLLLFLSGGASNPFVSYFLVPVTISAAILPWSYTWIVAGSSLLAYSLLLFIYQPLPEIMPMEMGLNMNMNSSQADAGMIPNLHIIGMWFNFVVSSSLITYFVVKMAQEIRSQASKITEYREEMLRDEQILAVATQAAGTAHELGTPLSTIAITLKEMEGDYADNVELQKDISLLKQQISRCKNSLQELVAQADFKKGKTLQETRLSVFIETILDQWKLMRPEVSFTFTQNTTHHPTNSDPILLVESTLQQAIMNFLNNAADASSQGIEVNLSWDQTHWGLQIRDFGEGIADDIAKQLGTKIISTKESGLGVGWVLSQASINRLGGDVRIYQHEVQGSVTEIKLPLSAAINTGITNE